MRNMLEYPVMHQEAIEWLDHILQEDIKDQEENGYRCGNMTGEIVKYIKENLK